MSRIFRLELVQPNFDRLFNQYREKFDSIYGLSIKVAREVTKEVFGSNDRIEIVKTNDSVSLPQKGDVRLNKDSKGEKLLFDEETGQIAYKNVQNIAKFGRKDNALLGFFARNKNAPFTIEDIKKHCNPKVNKKTHWFKSEKDIDDTLRQIRFKLKVPKGSIFQIRKGKNYKNETTWTWHE